MNAESLYPLWSGVSLLSHIPPEWIKLQRRGQKQSCTCATRVGCSIWYVLGAYTELSGFECDLWPTFLLPSHIFFPVARPDTDPIKIHCRENVLNKSVLFWNSLIKKHNISYSEMNLLPLFCIFEHTSNSTPCFGCLGKADIWSTATKHWTSFGCGGSLTLFTQFLWQQAGFWDVSGFVFTQESGLYTAIPVKTVKIQQTPWCTAHMWAEVAL